jgi:hypothetical protein
LETILRYQKQEEDSEDDGMKAYRRYKDLEGKPSTDHWHWGDNSFQHFDWGLHAEIGQSRKVYNDMVKRTLKLFVLRSENGPLRFNGAAAIRNNYSL